MSTSALLLSAFGAVRRSLREMRALSAVQVIALMLALTTRHAVHDLRDDCFEFHLPDLHLFHFP
ncbi:hypothetical protein [Pantoea sp. 18069]|uniref:hypothetical protein n=1 Tax=Pantoea sp. 18069 TaxID=2681415 RepID=UPI001358B595|nr:hypothetical protein [Pantoea sp. 18069]